MTNQGFNPVQPAGTFPTPNYGTPSWLDRNKGTLGEVGKQTAMFAGQNIGNLAYLGEQGKRYDKVNYGSVNPNLVDYSRVRGDIKDQGSAGNYNLRQNVSGNAGLYANAALGNITNTGRALANVGEREANENTLLRNQAFYAIQGYKMQGMQDEAANKGQALTNYYQTLGNVGQNVMGQTKDYNLGQRDKSLESLLKSGMYKWDSNKRDVVYIGGK